MKTSVISAQDVIVCKNFSGLEERVIAHKVRDLAFPKGFHVMLFQDRYKNGSQFLMDWRPTGGKDDFRSRDWNVLVEVK